MIVDKNDKEIQNPDLEKGYLVDDEIIVHHEAVKAVQEQSHYEVIAEYENGGQDVEKIIDVAGVAGHEAYGERIQVQRYIEYTAEEIAEREAEQAEAESMPTMEDRIAALESAMLDMMMGGIE